MLDMNRIPASIAIIMDGNGRWAKKRFLPRVAGHNAGMLAMKEIIKTFLEMNFSDEERHKRRIALIDNYEWI